MNASPAGSSRQAIAPEDERSPLYKPYQHSEEETEDQHAAPEVEATPEQVRDFLVSLLVTERGLDSDRCQQIASRWTTGKGRELRSYPPAMYLEIFGREDGWIVYREVKLCMSRDVQKKKEKTKTRRAISTGTLL